MNNRDAGYASMDHLQQTFGRPSVQTPSWNASLDFGGTLWQKYQLPGKCWNNCNIKLDWLRCSFRFKTLRSEKLVERNRLDRLGLKWKRFIETTASNPNLTNLSKCELCNQEVSCLYECTVMHLRRPPPSHLHKSWDERRLDHRMARFDG